MRFLCIFLIRCYQVALSPLKRFIPGDHGSCRFHPTCSSFGIAAFRLHGGLKGGVLTLKRIFRCHPWGDFGFDPAPAVLRWKHLIGFRYSDEDGLRHSVAIDGAVLTLKGRFLAEGASCAEAANAAELGNRGAEGAICYCSGPVSIEDVAPLRDAGVSRIVILANAPAAVVADALESSKLAIDVRRLS